MNHRDATNRKNAAKSTGPIDTSKTRCNAQKHGLLSQGVTELDLEIYEPTLNEFLAYFKPEGPLETRLVRRLALYETRLRRIEMIEAEFITAELHPPIIHVEKYVAKLLEAAFPGSKDDLEDKVVVVDPGLPARISVKAIEILGGPLTRYETTKLNQFFKTLHELERFQRARKGELVPPPIAVDIAVSGH